MATKTPNYNLEKPEQTDYYDVDVQNNNMDIIDSNLKAQADAIGNAAQETTLQEVKTNVDAVKTSADTIDSKIGALNDTQDSTGITGSAFAKLNYLVAQVRDYLSGIYFWTGSTIGKIGNANDTGATETFGTVMGKLNNLILKKQKFLSRKITTTAVGIGGSNTITINGSGIFYAISIVAPNSADNVTTSIDGVPYTGTVGYNSGALVFINQKFMPGGFVLDATTTYSYYLDTIPFSTIEFNNNLTITYTPTSPRSIKIIYALYE